ncbi:MAG: starch-binding protein, partial [Muribaculaceae bacterium]|nr:starch-binding protein [Muribaculaceae bacterium]
TPSIDGNWIVYLENTASWSDPMTWIWDAGNGNKNYTGGNWPGARMKSITVDGFDNLYYYDFQADEMIRPMIIFNPGGDNGKTKDLELINKAVYDCNGNITGSIETPVTGLDAINADIDAPAEYYNLQGIRVINPTHGAYIYRRGSKVSKVLIP